MALFEAVRGDTAAGAAGRLCAGEVAERGVVASSARVVAVMDFAEHVVGNATSILGDIGRLRAHGLSDMDIRDVAAAAARCFVGTVLDAVGAQADAAPGAEGALSEDVVPPLRAGRTVGRAPQPSNHPTALAAKREGS